jgi:hypothetical protein
MKIEVKRHWFSTKSTIALWVMDGVTFGFTLEDVARAQGVKIPGETAIQAGEYKMIVDQSTRFNRLMPHILDVPQFDGVRVHCGNTDQDTEGCLLLGMEKHEDTVLQSQTCFDKIFPLIKAAFDRSEEITVVITNEPI